MRSSYRQRVSVYRKAETETSPEDWVLMAQHVPMSIRGLSASGQLAAEAVFGMIPRHMVTHRGRCEYEENIQAGRDRVLLRDEDTDQQFLVTHLAQSVPFRGGQADYVLHLSELRPPMNNLAFG